MYIFVRTLAALLSSERTCSTRAGSALVSPFSSIILTALVMEENLLQDWQITLGFTLDSSITPDDALELMERLSAYGAVATLTSDGNQLEVALSITNSSAILGLQEAIQVLEHDPITATAPIISIEVIDEQEVARHPTKDSSASPCIY